MEEAELQAPQEPAAENVGEKEDEVPVEGGTEEGAPKRPSKATLKAKEAWKGTIRKKKNKKEDLQEQQDAFDMFLDFVNSVSEEDRRKTKGNELPQFNPDAIAEDVVQIEETVTSIENGEIKVEQTIEVIETKPSEEEQHLDEEIRLKEEAETQERKRREEEEIRANAEAARKAEELKREEEARRAAEEAERKERELAEAERKRKEEEERKKKEQQKEENMRRFQQMTSAAPSRPSKKATSATANKFATLKVSRVNTSSTALPRRFELSREAPGTTSTKNMTKDLESTTNNNDQATGDDWENQVLGRWATFMDTAKKAKAAKAAAAAAAAAAAPPQVVEETKKTKKKREDDALLIIGALRKVAPPSDAPPAEDVVEEEKKRELRAQDGKSAATPYLLNMYKYRGVNVDFTDLFGDADTFSTPGVHVWCVNPEGPAIQEVEVDAKFNMNGSYLVLQSTGSGESVEHRVYTWAPNSTTRCIPFTSVGAVYSAMLTSHLGRAHVTHNLKDEEEPELQNCFFPQEIGYTNDPLQGFPTVTPRAPKPGLIEHVGFSTPLSSSNCYVLVAQKEGAIYVWNGNQSDIHSRGRAFEYARDTRRYFLNIPSIVNVTEGEEPALFSKHLTQRKEEEEAEEEPNDLILYAVKQGAMKLDLKEVPDAEPPFALSYITTPKSALIIDNTTDIFVFLGPGCPKPIRRGSEECAKLFYTHYDRPDWAKVWIIQPGKPSKTGERQFLHPFFAQFFEREPEPQLKRAVTRSEADLRAQVALDVAECLKQKPVETKRAAKPVDAQQSVEVWGTVPNSSNFKKLPPNIKGQFYRQDSALVVVNNPGDERTFPSASMYWWQGEEASKKIYTHFYFGMYQALAKKMQEEDYPRPVVYYVHEHKEPAEFAELFGGNIIIHMGTRTGPQQTLGRLYQLRKSSIDINHLAEVPLEVSSLHSGDIFLLVAGTKGPIYLWNGKASDSSLKKTAENLAKQLVEGASVEHVGEGGEPQPFWDILGDPQTRDPLTTASAITKYAGQVSLYTITNETGQPEVALVHPFWTSDLTPSRVVLLDANSEIYLWIGERISGTTSYYANIWVEEYVRKARETRKGEDIKYELVEPGKEPPEFKRHFHAWFRPETKRDVLEVREEQLKAAAQKEYQHKMQEVYSKLFGEAQ